MENAITVEATINAPVEKVWKMWSGPEHIVNWSFASDDWEAPNAENDLRENGKFKTVFAAKDGSARFDFEGIYTKVEEHKFIAYAMADGRQVEIIFENLGNSTKVTETFQMEHENSAEMQKNGWQSIMNNFKKYVEAQG